MRNTNGGFRLPNGEPHPRQPGNRENMRGKSLTLISERSMPVLRYIIILSPMLLFVTANSKCQSLTESKFKRYTTADGLSDNNVTGLAQDATGYIWLATTAGLNRYDGTRFIQYHSSNDSLSPASENFIRINRLDKDRIAVLPTGVHIINTRTNERKNLFVPYHDKQYQYKFNMMEKACGDEKGNTYVLTRAGFYHFDKFHHLLFRFDYFSGKDVPATHFYFGNDLIELDDNRLLVVTKPGLYIYDKAKHKFSKLNAGDYPLLDEFTVTTQYCRFFQVSRGKFIITKTLTDSIFYFDIAAHKKTVSRSAFSFSAGNIQWRSKLIRVNESSFYLTDQTSGFYRVKIDDVSGLVTIAPEKYFAGYLCNDILIANDHRAWIATSNGLFQQDDATNIVEVAAIPTEVKAKFPNLGLTCTFVTSNKIYAGAKAGGGLMIFDKKTMAFEKNLLFSTQQKNNTLYRLTSPRSNMLLAGSLGDLFVYNESTGKTSTMNPAEWTSGDWTSDLFNDSKGNIWISSSNIYRYDPVENKFTIIPFRQPMPSIPVAIREDRSRNIWMAGHGIVRYNISTKQFDRRVDSFPYIKMPDKQVTAMDIDRYNTIWFGNANNGLIGYNIDNKTFRHFTVSDGIPGNEISALLAVDDQLWIACYSGLACLDLTSMQVKSFGKDEGFPEMPLQPKSAFFYDSSTQKLYLGFSEAVARFNPAEILVPQERPDVFIETLRISGDSVFFLPGNSIKTSWRQNDLMITIGSINFNDGRSQGYAYRIVNYSDAQWQQLGDQNSFSISNLSPGKHRIQVKIFSRNNRWPEQVKEITVEVLPPFWKKAWFRILAVMLLLGLIYLLIQWRIANIRKKEKEKTQVEKLKADDYRNKYELEQITSYFSSSLADKKTADEVLWDVAENLIGRMNYVDCMIYLWNTDKTKMIQKAAYGLKGKPEILSEQVFDVKPGQGVVGYVMQTMEPVLIKDTRTDKRYRVDEASRLSEICVPIIHNNELLGIIDSEHPELNYYSERDTIILTAIATLIGNKLKQLESEQTLEVKEQELSSINEQLAEAKLSALQAQMNPHFVFNALNSIKRMILDGENEKASRYLSKFALMIRMTLNHSKDAFVTLAENIEYIKTYLGMEQLRFDDSFQWTLTVANDIDPEETNIPALMIQPLVENAIWHGLLPSTGDKKLSVSFTKNKNRINCTIEDNGIGIRQSEKMKEQARNSHHSVGLDNLRNRVKILNEKYGADCSLSIIDLDETGNGSGTRVTLQFNMIDL